MNERPMPPPSAHAGFNLVEMMVTLVIIGIVVAAAVPNFTARNERYRVEGAAQELGTRIQLARQRAVAERVPYRATIDPGDRVYYFERQENDSTWVRSPDQTYEIEGVTDLDLTVGGRESETVVRLETRGTLQLEDAPVEVKFVSATEDTATLSVVRTGRAIVTMSN